MFTKEELEELHIKTRKYSLNFYQTRVEVDGNILGDKKSVYSGSSGIEMNKVREFVPGDDPRNIDYNLSEKKEKLIIVEREEEREMQLLIILDLSRSMFLRQKPYIMYSAASMLMYSALDQDIPTALLGRAGGFEISKTPASGRGQLRRTINLLQKAIIDPRQVPKRSLTINNWRKVLSKGSFIFVISDFLGKNNFFIKLLNNRYSQYNIRPIVVQDNLEYSFPCFPSRSNLSLVDVGSGDIQRKHVGKKQAKEIKIINEERFERLKGIFDNRNLRYAHLATFDLPEIKTAIQRIIR